MATLGFVVLSHSDTPQLARLIFSLNQNYHYPSIVIHHDHSKSRLPLTSDDLGKNVLIVAPHFLTQWSHISVIDSFLVSLEMLFTKFSPQWFMLLSAACYPVANGDRVMRELENSEFDAYIEHHNISKKFGLSSPTTVKEQWFLDCQERYISTAQWPNQPFSNNYDCYVGEDWFTGNYKAAITLINSRREQNTLFYHYCRVFNPGESYCQTILANKPELKLCIENRRYSDWSLGGSHPKELTEIDLPALLNSNCHFARKFTDNISDGLVQKLDLVHAALR